MTRRLPRILYTNTINIDTLHESLDIFIFRFDVTSSERSYEINRLLSEYVSPYALRVAAARKRIFKEIPAHFVAALENVYCSRSVCSSRSTSPTKRAKWRRNPRGLASCGRNERTEGLSHWIRLLTTPISTEKRDTIPCGRTTLDFLAGSSVGVIPSSTIKSKEIMGENVHQREKTQRELHRHDRRGANYLCRRICSHLMQANGHFAVLSRWVDRARFTVVSHFNRKRTPFRRAWLLGCCFRYFPDWRPVEKQPADSTFHHVRTACHATKAERNYGLMNTPRAAKPRRSLLLFLRHRYPRGLPFTKRGQYRAQQKLHAHLGFAWSAPGWPRRRFPVSKPLASQRRTAEGSIMRTAYQMSQGLPRSDTVTKVVIVWSTSAGEACQRSLLRSFYSRILNIWHACPGHFRQCSSQTFWILGNRRILGAQN